MDIASFINLVTSFISTHASLLISLFALAFTIGSFWWMNLHKGKILVGTPRAFAAISQGLRGMLLVRLPLLFYNDGAHTIIIYNLRLTLKQKERKSAVLYFNQTVDKLTGEQADNWAIQFAVAGRKTSFAICEFVRLKEGNFVFAAEECEAILEVKYDESGKWRQLKRFNLQTPEKCLVTLNAKGPILAYDNDPDRGRER